jgi:hypothetical protein
VNIPAALERELQGYCLAAEHELRVYTLEEVARLTHFSLRFLTVACRGGELIHTRQGKFRGMTRAQIRNLLDLYSEGGAEGAGLPLDDLEQARQASRRNARRGRRAWMPEASQ